LQKLTAIQIDKKYKYKAIYFLTWSVLPYSHVEVHGPPPDGRKRHYIERWSFTNRHNMEETILQLIQSHGYADDM